MGKHLVEEKRWLNFPHGRPVGKLVLAEKRAFCDFNWVHKEFSEAVGRLVMPPGSYAGLIIDQITLSKQDENELDQKSTQGILDIFKSLDDYRKHPELKTLFEAHAAQQKISNLNPSDSVEQLFEIHTTLKSAAVAIAQRTLNDPESTMIEQELAFDLIGQPDNSTTVDDYVSHWINKKSTERLRNATKRSEISLALLNKEDGCLRGVAPEDGFAFLEKISVDDLVALSIGSGRSRFFTDDDCRFIETLSELKSLALDNTLITDESLKYLQKMTQISSLSLSHTKVTGAGLSHIKGLSSLTSLILYSTNVTDDGLVFLDGLPQLRKLNLRYTGITDAGLAYLQKLPSLRKLYIGGTQISDSGLKHLGSMKELTEVGLSGTQISDAGLAHLAGAVGIKRLNLWNTNVSDTGVEQLVTMKDLTALNLAGTQVTDDALAYVSKMRKLQQLDLAGTGVTDTGLRFLHEMPNLKRLDLSNTSVTSSGLELLQETGLVTLGYTDINF